MPEALNKVRSMRFVSIIETILYLLENITEESFWQSILGERLTKLGQRYFGNDFVMLGILFYIAPILRSRWQDLVDFCMDRYYSRSKTVNVRIYYNEEAYDAINYYVNLHTERLPGMVDAICMYEESKPKAENQKSTEEEKPKIGFYPRINTTNEIEYKGRKLTICACTDEDEKLTSHRPNYLNITMDLSANDSIDTLKDILQEWSDGYHSTEDTSIKVLQWDGYESWIYKDSIEPRGYDSVNLPPGVKENILGDMKLFVKRRNWYKRKGLPYRRGFLLYGPPGSGKSSLINALAGKMQFDLALIKLGEVGSDSEFSNCVSAVPKDTLLIIEDIDHYDESNSDSSVTKSGMLNALDGINGNDGSMVFMTCNDMNKITPALLRPGRMDVKLELGYAVHEQIEAMFWRFFATLDFDDSDDEDDKINIEEDQQGQQQGQHDTVTTTSSNLPPTPVSEPEDDEEEEVDTEDQDKERMAYLNATLQKLLALIPEHHVTTAEMQSLFVTLFLEAGPNKIDEKELLERLLQQVPEFMERIKLDREQAKLHDKLANKDDDDDKADTDKDSDAEGDDTKDNNDNANDDKKDDNSEKTDSASS
ncbi:hypothetical protein [Absidia glauca]|uniref:AAA+ ATPase domain-containing protein n=1 Tax=Absidia glauca TaxID=4829 RepID=A0A168NHS4_ABSGL|nr:hypothetical protein [Absidia glauca]